MRLGDGHVLLANARDAGVALPVALRLAVDEVVVVQVLRQVEAAVPARAVFGMYSRVDARRGPPASRAARLGRQIAPGPSSRG